MAVLLAVDLGIAIADEVENQVMVGEYDQLLHEMIFTRLTRSICEL